MNKEAFSLIELIVGITISMILMVSVGIFISNGMQNIFKQQLILENTDNITDFAGDLHSAFNLIQTGSFTPEITGSGVLFKRGQHFGEGGFSYIGTESIDGVYCDTDAEDTFTNSVFIKTFIPFEEQSEDIFSNYNDVLTGSGGSYTSHQKEHVIKDNSGNIIVGKGIFGNDFTPGASGTGIYLNSPTGLAQDGNDLYISDTLNNRIIHYDISTNEVNILLDETDGLNEPTGLYYENDSLYIANSGNGEILKYSSDNVSTNPNSLTLSFSGVTANNIDNFKAYFYNTNGGVTLTSPINNNTDRLKLDFSTNINEHWDYIKGNGNRIDYYLSNFNSIESTDGPKAMSCSDSTNYSVESGVVKEYKTTCQGSGTGTITKRFGPENTNFIASEEYSITINDIQGSFPSDGTNYVNLRLYDGLTQQHSSYFPYFTDGDGDLTTPDDNTLEVIHSGLKYPTGIWGENNFNEFGNGSYSNITYDEGDNILGTPVESLDVSVDTVNSSDMLNFILKYYKSYNCYNLDDKSKRTYILKKSLK